MSKYKKGRIILFLVLVLIIYAVHNKHPSVEQKKGDIFVPVVKVHDGDTVSLIIYGRKERVRLIGIDAPETGQKPWGKEAKKYLEKVLSLSEWKVRPEFDIDRNDKYGRLLAYLWTSKGEMVNLLMLKSGNAVLFTFPPNVKYIDELNTAQREARKKKLGIWSDKGLKELPGDYRKEHPRIELFDRY